MDQLLEKLKKEYDALPVPGELELRVHAAAKRAKKERKHPMKHFWKTAGAAAAAILLCITALANTSGDLARAMERIPVLGAITRVVTFRTYEDERDTSSAHIDVPRVEGGGAALDDAISRYTAAVIEQYEKDAEAGHYSVDLHYETVTDSETLFALRFNETVIMGSGAETVRIYNVDKASGRILALGDLFRENSDYLGVLSEEIRRQMRARMKADDTLTYWIDSDMPEFDFTALDPETAFYVNENGELTIVFNEGDVGPMSMGVQEFTIPSSAVAEIALPRYLA